MESEAPLCGDCMRELNRALPMRSDPPPGVDRIVSCADHSGTARDLLAAFKFRHLIDLAGLIAGFMADSAGPRAEDTLLVPVPPARWRTWRRGFDPVGLLTGELGNLTGSPRPEHPVLVRRGSGRQRGQGRAGRLSDPPDIRPSPEAEGQVGGRRILLVDDVMTTGATLSASAASLRKAGAIGVSAVTFTRKR